MTASSNRAPARRRLLLASDRGDQSSELAGILGSVGDVGTVTTHDIPEAPAGKFSGIVVDINLRSAESVQRVRRKLVSDNHPDKLIGRGVPPEFVELATRKLAAINAAYDSIAKERAL